MKKQSSGTHFSVVSLLIGVILGVLISSILWINNLDHSSTVNGEQISNLMMQLKDSGINPNPAYKSLK